MRHRCVRRAAGRGARLTVDGRAGRGAATGAAHTSGRAAGQRGRGAAQRAIARKKDSRRDMGQRRHVAGESCGRREGAARPAALCWPMARAATRPGAVVSREKGTPHIACRVCRMSCRSGENARAKGRARQDVRRWAAPSQPSHRRAPTSSRSARSGASVQRPRDDDRYGANLPPCHPGLRPAREDARWICLFWRMAEKGRFRITSGPGSPGGMTRTGSVPDQSTTRGHSTQDAARPVPRARDSDGRGATDAAPAE